MAGRKALAYLTGLTLLSGAAVVMMCWPAPNPRISLDNFNCIKTGMTYAEVEALIGPHGDHRSGPTVVTEPFSMWRPGLGRCPPGMEATPLSGGYWTVTWQTDQAEILVMIEPAVEGQVGHLAWSELAPGRVIAAHYCDAKLEHGPVYNALWRARRQWHRWFPG